MAEKIKKSDAEWKKQLGANEYFVTRQKGTEPPFTGEYEETETPGMYMCVCCGQPLFESEAKFHSGSGWPSFSKPVTKTAWKWSATPAMACFAKKSCAAGVMRISGMFLMTARSLRGSGFALILRR